MSGRKIKVLFLCSRFYPSSGGVEKHAYEVAQRLKVDGFEVSVFSEKDFVPAGRVKAEAEKVGFFSFRKFHIWWALWKHRRLIEEADIVHCHDVFFWYLPFRFIYPFKKVYTTFHGYETVYPPRLKAKLIRRLSAFLSWGTINVGAFIQKWYGTWPDYVVYGGIEPSKKMEGQNRLLQQSGLGSVLVLGRLEADTFPPLYFDLLRNLQSGGVMKVDRVEVCGDGSLRGRFEKFGMVRGWISDQKKLVEHIQKADIVLASSYLSILEALSHGKYVIALYDNPLKHDYLRMSPFASYIEISNDPKQVAKKIAKNPAIIWEKREERMKAVSAYTWDAVTEIYKELWKI